MSSVKYGTLASILAWTLMLVPGLASAKSEYLLTVVDVSAGQNAEVLDVIAQVREAFEEHPNVQQRELHRMLDAGANDAHYGNVESAKKSFRDGNVAFDRGRYDEALANLENTSFFLKSSFGFVKSPGLFIDNLLYLAASQLEVATHGGLSTDEEVTRDDAIATIEILLIKFPKLIYATQRFTSEFNQLVEKVRSKIVRFGKGDLRIETEDGTSASAYVNGTYRGVTPLTAFGLTEGEHFVRLIAQGRSVGQAVVQVKTNRKTDVSIPLQGARNGKVLNELIGRLREDLQRPNGTPEHIHELKGLLHTDYVVLIQGTPAAYGTEVHAGLFNLMSGARIRSTRVVFGRGGPRRPSSTLVSRLLKVEDPAQQVVATVDSGESIFNQWWFWAGGAVLVAGGIITVVILSQDDAPPQGITKMPDTGALIIRF